MGENNNLDRRVEERLREILGYDPFSSREVREDITQEKIDELVGMLKERDGISEKEAQERINKYIQIVPTREMATIMDRAEELAKDYLPNLADEVVNGIPYLNTTKGPKLQLCISESVIDGNSVDIPIYLFAIRQGKELDEENRRRATAYVPSGSYIIVDQPLGDYKIIGPTKEEFRQITLETALDYLTSPIPKFLKGKTQ